MTTPEQLLADRGWRLRHSTYTLWSFFTLGFISLLYTGIRARRARWIAAGAFYGVLVLGAVALSSATRPEDPDAPRGALNDLAAWMLIVGWISSLVHVFVLRPEWLRWAAVHATQPRWYEGSAHRPPPPPVGRHAPDTLGVGHLASDLLAPTPMPLAPPNAAIQPGVSGRDVSSPATSLGADAGGTPSPTVDLNVATVETLAALPGIGISVAARLVDERQRRGGFGSVDEAAMAAGLAPHLRARLRQVAVVNPATPGPPTRPRRRGRVVDA